MKNIVLFLILGAGLQLTCAGEDYTAPQQSSSIAQVPREYLPGIEAGAAEYAGNVNLEDLILDREKYFNKVVALSFESGSFLHSTGKKSAAMVIYEKSYSAGICETLKLFGQQALEWAVDVSKKGSYANNVYTLVGDQQLIALGSRRTKDNDCYKYEW